MGEPICAGEHLRLVVALLRGKPEVGVNELQLLPVDVDFHPHCAPWHHGPVPGFRVEPASPNQPHGEPAEDHVAPALALEVVVDVPSYYQRQFVRQVLAGSANFRAETRTREFLKSNDVGLVSFDDLCDARG